MWQFCGQRRIAIGGGEELDVVVDLDVVVSVDVYVVVVNETCGSMAAIQNNMLCR